MNFIALKPRFAEQLELHPRQSAKKGVAATEALALKNVG